MPFCEDCARYWAPTAMTPSGACPTCGRLLEAKTADGPLLSGSNANSGKVDLRALASSGGDDDAAAPWHFKLLVFGLVVYLGWRIIDLFM